ncbi:MAG: hypothetical protein AB1458_07110 [Bacteroidota bacterium]
MSQRKPFLLLLLSFLSACGIRTYSPTTPHNPTIVDPKETKLALYPISSNVGFRLSHSPLKKTVLTIGLNYDLIYLFRSGEVAAAYTITSKENVIELFGGYGLTLVNHSDSYKYWRSSRLDTWNFSGEYYSCFFQPAWTKKKTKSSYGFSLRFDYSNYNRFDLSYYHYENEILISSNTLSARNKYILYLTPAMNFKTGNEKIRFISHLAMVFPLQGSLPDISAREPLNTVFFRFGIEVPVKIRRRSKDS